MEAHKAQEASTLAPAPRKTGFSRASRLSRAKYGTPPSKLLASGVARLHSPGCAGKRPRTSLTRWNHPQCWVIRSPAAVGAGGGSAKRAGGRAGVRMVVRSGGRAAVGSAARDSPKDSPIEGALCGAAPARGGGASLHPGGPRAHPTALLQPVPVDPLSACKYPCSQRSAGTGRTTATSGGVNSCGNGGIVPRCQTNQSSVAARADAPASRVLPPPRLDQPPAARPGRWMADSESPQRAMPAARFAATDIHALKRRLGLVQWGGRRGVCSGYNTLYFRAHEGIKGVRAA